MNRLAKSQSDPNLLCGVIVSILVDRNVVVVRSSFRGNVLVLVDPQIMELGFRLGDAWNYHGSSEIHPTFGDIFKATHGQIIFPDDDLLPHFISLNFSGISEKCSRQLFAVHSKHLANILNNGDWQTLINTRGCKLNLSVAFAFIERWKSLKTEIITISYFHSIFLTTGEAVEFNKLHSDRSCEIIERNPYTLLSVASFERVDNIAIKYFGIDHRNSMRTNAAISAILSYSYQNKNYFLEHTTLMNQVKSRCKLSEAASAKAIRHAVKCRYIIFKDELYYSKSYFRAGQLMQQLVISKSKPIERFPIRFSISLIRTSDRELYSVIGSIINHTDPYGVTQAYFLSNSRQGCHPNFPGIDLIHAPTLDFVRNRRLTEASNRLLVICDSESLSIGEMCQLLSSLRDEQLLIFLTRSQSIHDSLFLKYISDFQISFPIISPGELNNSDIVPLQFFKSSLDETKQIGNMIVSERTHQEKIAFNLWFFISTQWSGNCVIVSLSKKTHEETKKIAISQIMELNKSMDLSGYNVATNVEEFAFTVGNFEMRPSYISHQRSLVHDIHEVALLDRTILILKTEDAPNLDQIKNLMQHTQKQFIIVGDANAISHPFRIWSHS